MTLQEILKNFKGSEIVLKRQISKLETREIHYDHPAQSTFTAADILATDWIVELTSTERMQQLYQKHFSDIDRSIFKKLVLILLSNLTSWDELKKIIERDSDVKTKKEHCLCESKRESVFIGQVIEGPEQFVGKYYVNCCFCGKKTGFHDTVEQSIANWNEKRQHTFNPLLV